MPAAYVLADIYGWSTPLPGRPDRLEQHVGRKGDRIEVSEEELARGLALAAAGNGGLSVDEGDVDAAFAASVEPPSWDDMQLDSANVEDTVAYLVQHPSEAPRVLDRERSRPERGQKTRKGVVESAERVHAEHTAELEAVADERAQAEEAEQAAFERSQGTASTAPSIPGPQA